jgi:TolB protein
MATRDGNTDIYAMDPDGSHQTRLAFNGCYVDMSDWSPDSSKIVFHCNMGPDPSAGSEEIYVMNRDGSSETRLAYNPASD